MEFLKKIFNDELNLDGVVSIIGSDFERHSILQKMEEPQMSKLLTTFDSERSAQLTKILYSGKPIISQIP